MFAAMHESVHRTAFKSRWLNNAVGWFAGLLSFYNSTFYRHYHGWHHRFTQLPGKDPELDDRKPTSLRMLPARAQRRDLVDRQAARRTPRSRSAAIAGLRRS